MDIFSPYIGDYDSVLNFSSNLVSIHNAFKNGLFDTDNDLCYSDNICENGSNEKIYYAINKIKSKQMYNNFCYEASVDWEYNYITFSHNEGFVLRKRNYLNDNIDIKEQEVDFEEYFEIDISEESYFQLSTIHDTLYLNTIFVYAILYQNGCTDFYLDLDYYDVCLEKINV